jgi:hypothetical protein
MSSRYLEVRTALRTANKSDLFTGNVNDMHSKQAVKENVVVFYLHEKTKQISGPHYTHTYSDFLQLYTRCAFNLVGTVVPMPEEVTNEFIFDMVLRQAKADDVKEVGKYLKIHQVYYIYDDHKLTGPLFIDHSVTLLYLDNLIAKKQLFVPNERQHFRKKELKKAS